MPRSTSMVGSSGSAEPPAPVAPRLPVRRDGRRWRQHPAPAIVIAHRGASGHRPEHTLASYALAIEQGADYIEPDLVSTGDGALVARHENEIGGTTDVASHAAFAGRRTTKRVDGTVVTGWFTEDFTLAELKTLRAVERIPAIRPSNATFDGIHEIPTLQEIIDLVRSVRARGGPAVGIYPETKLPSYFASLGLPLEQPLVETLHANGFRSREHQVLIQSLEVTNLRELHEMTDLPLIQLVKSRGAPRDLVIREDRRTYADLVSPAGLGVVARYAAGIGPHKDLVIPRTGDDALAAPTHLVADAHAAGLAVHPFTFRRENRFLPAEHRIGVDPNGPGDLAGEISAFLAAGIDGYFTDNPAVRPSPGRPQSDRSGSPAVASR
ncbi:MAG: glycerophosphodiester phosphodiesterase [Actinomycetota bacterium]|nr:glycerophosphodiester phosphodiesterase [Actinomycetota bacterium]